jgi:hypothetical protein
VDPPRTWFSAHKSLIHLADARSVSEFRPVRLVFRQGEANPVHEEQSRLVGDLTVALHLPRAHALFAGANAPESMRPVPQWQFGSFVNRARAHRVLLAANTAAPKIAFIPPARPVFHLVNIGALTMGAYGRVAPALPFKKLNGRLFITAGFGEVIHDVRLRKLRMFSIIHGPIFHDQAGHWRGNPRKKVKICVVYLLPRFFWVGQPLSHRWWESEGMELENSENRGPVHAAQPPVRRSGGVSAVAEPRWISTDFNSFQPVLKKL